MIQLTNCKNLKEVKAQLGDESKCRENMIAATYVLSAHKKGISSSQLARDRAIMSQYEQEKTGKDEGKRG